MRTSKNKYDITFNYGFGAYSVVRLDLTPDEIRGIVKLMNGERDQSDLRAITLIEIVFEGEDEEDAKA